MKSSNPIIASLLSDEKIQAVAHLAKEPEKFIDALIDK